MAHCNYYLGPWVWDASDPDGPAWTPPVGTVGSIDLRSIPTMSTGVVMGDRPYGFFATTVTLPSEYTLLGTGDLREISSTGGMKSAWQAHTGYLPDGDTLIDLLADQMTMGSDPTGLDANKPLMPTSSGSLEIHLAGHSKVWSRAFGGLVSGHGNRVLTLIQNDFRRTIDDSMSGRLNSRHGRGDKQHYRRILDALVGKYGVGDDWKRLVPPGSRRNIEGPLPHETTIGDTFVDTNGVLLADHTATGSGGGFTWTVDLYSVSSPGTQDIQGNNYSATGTGNTVRNRADSDLSGDDHSSQISVVAWDSVGSVAILLCRVEASESPEAYAFIFRNKPIDTYKIKKQVGGVGTQLGANLNEGPIVPSGQIGRLNVNGSGLMGTIDGVRKIGLETDTAITGNLRCGCGNEKGDLGNFSASDISLAITGTATATIGESDVVTGEKVVVYTLTGDTFSKA